MALENNPPASPLQSDVWIYRVVVVIPGLTILVSLAGAIVLTCLGVEVPQVVIALGSAKALDLIDRHKDAP